MARRNLDLAAVTLAFQRLFLADPGSPDGVFALRREDHQKVREVTGLFEAIGPLRERDVLVDAAGGKGSVGVLAAALLGARRVVIIEREASYASLARAAVARLGNSSEVDVRQAGVEDPSAWPTRPDVTVALHACGAASDHVLDAAIASESKRLFLVPCCYADAVPFSSRARALAEAMGVPRHAEVRRRAVIALIDAERTLRLEAAGYETIVAPFVPPTVTPHHLVWRARRVGEPTRMAAAAEGLRRLRVGGTITAERKAEAKAGAEAQLPVFVFVSVFVFVRVTPMHVPNARWLRL